MVARDLLQMVACPGNHAGFCPMPQAAETRHGTETDRQTDGQTDKQTDRQTDGAATPVNGATTEWLQWPFASLAKCNIFY